MRAVLSPSSLPYLCLWMAAYCTATSVDPTFFPGRAATIYYRPAPDANVSGLAALKRKYDPDGFFKNNFWPLDKDGVPVEPLYNEPPSP